MELDLNESFVFRLSSIFLDMKIYIVFSSGRAKMMADDDDDRSRHSILNGFLSIPAIIWSGQVDLWFEGLISSCSAVVILIIWRSIYIKISMAFFAYFLIVYIVYFIVWKWKRLRAFISNTNDINLVREFHINYRDIFLINWKNWLKFYQKCEKTSKLNV